MKTQGLESALRYLLALKVGCAKKDYESRSLLSGTHVDQTPQGRQDC